jgi:hypothetical protein
MKHNAIGGWLDIGGKRNFFKSRAEIRFALYLQFLKEKHLIAAWSYEPKIFWFNQAGANLKCGTVSYKPDFLVIPFDGHGQHSWVEVKGYMDARSKTKIKRFKKYFPEEKLVVIDAKWFKINMKKLKGLIPGW